MKIDPAGEMPASIAVGREAGANPIPDTRYTYDWPLSAALSSIVSVLICLWRHSSEWRGPRSYLVGGLERDPAPIQKQAEHIEPADHKYDLARDRLTVLV